MCVCTYLQVHIFTGEKMFTVKENFNKQNNRIYTRYWNKTKNIVQGIQRNLIVFL